MASLGTRSPHTILKRVNAVLAYLRWFDVFVEARSSAFEEEAYWKYVKFLKRSGSAASCGNSFRASVLQSTWLVWISLKTLPEGVKADVSSLPPQLAAVVKQAEALAVKQLLKFHDLLHREGADAWDQAFGAYGRCRQSDMSWVDRVDWEVTEGEAEPGLEGYVVIYTRHHKTARATAKKALLLPIILSAASVDSRPWLPAARQAFERVGLKLCGWTRGPLLRPLSLGGECKALGEALTSYEVSFCLMHLPLKGSSAPPARPNKRSRDEQPSRGRGRGRASSSKGKGRSKSSPPWVSIPKFIRDRGGVAALPSGEAVCFDFNIQGDKCKCKPDSCPRKHVCAKCFGNRPIKDHKE